MSERAPVLLFISRESATYVFTRRQVESACEKAGVALRIVHIEDEPEFVAEYDVDVLPTVVTPDRRIVGRLDHEAVDALVDLVGPAASE